MILAKKINFVLIVLLSVAFQLGANGGPALASFSNGYAMVPVFSALSVGGRSSIGFPTSENPAYLA